MKVGFISDIHSNHLGLETVLKKLSEVDKIFCAGDITGYYPFPNDVISLLKKFNVSSVRGNHDQYVLDGIAPAYANDSVRKSVADTEKILTRESIQFLKKLPLFIQSTVAGKRMLICHGSPWNYLEERVYPDSQNFDRFEKVDADVIILGHTHYPMIRKIKDKLILNPGSCGQPRDYNLLSFTIWDVEENLFKNYRLEWDLERFKKEAREFGTSEKLFEVFNRTQKIV